MTKKVEGKVERKVPEMTTDEEAEAFLDQDLSDLDFSQFRRGQFELEAKNAQVSMRLPKSLLRALKTQAEERGIPYQRHIRDLLEQGLHHHARK